MSPRAFEVRSVDVAPPLYSSGIDGERGLIRMRLDTVKVLELAEFEIPQSKRFGGIDH
jgi:hypothetical protein